MADYRDDDRWKEYGFGRDMFPGGRTAPVASSEYMTAGMWDDYIRPGIKWLGDVIPGIGRSDTSSRKTIDESKKLLKDMRDSDLYLRRSEKDAEEEARKELERYLREVEERDKTFKDASLDDAIKSSLELASAGEVTDAERAEAARLAALETFPDIPRFFTPFGNKDIRSPEKGVIGARYWGDDDPRDELKYGWIHSDYDKYWDRIDAYTKLISDHIVTTGMTAEEVERDYGDRILPEGDAIYHPDFDTEGYLKAYEERSDRESKAYVAEKLAEDLAYIEEKKAAELLLDPIDRGRPGWMTEGEWARGREARIAAVPTLDERLDVPDVRTYTGDPEERIAEALSSVTLTPDRDALTDKISTATVETARILEDMGLVPTGEGVRDELGTVIKDAKGGVPSPGLGYGGDTGFESGEAFRDVLEHALGAATVGEPFMDAREYYLGLTGGEPVDPMDLDTHAAIAGLSPTEAARAVTGESVRRIVDPSAPYASARSPEVLETKFEDAFGSSTLDSERLPISFTRGMSAEDERAAYLSSYDPYPGIIDPTFAPDASIHYTDPLKHYDTETVSGHLPLSLTTPYTTAVEGMEHAAEFAPPEWSYPAMPSPSDYSYPGFIPSSPFGTAPYSPAGYSPITGTFYPTAAEIIAAGGGELSAKSVYGTAPSPLMTP